MIENLKYAKLFVSDQRSQNIAPKKGFRPRSSENDQSERGSHCHTGSKVKARDAQFTEEGNRSSTFILRTSVMQITTTN